MTLLALMIAAILWPIAGLHMLWAFGTPGHSSPKMTSQYPWAVLRWITTSALPQSLSSRLSPLARSGSRAFYR